MTGSSLAHSSDEVLGPDVSAIVTEDGAPVDNIFSERQQRLLTGPLYVAWAGPPPGEDGARRTFFASANVGLFFTPREQPLVPDVMLSLDVEPHQDLWAKEHRSYFVWEFGKVPDVVIEVVSNREGNELGTKLQRYARMGVPYYVVWDPVGHLGDVRLRVFELRRRMYVAMNRPIFDDAGLSLSEWTGAFEGYDDLWLRWCDTKGDLLPTGAESADAERTRADTERTRADAERTRADTERTRADGLAAKLRAAGLDPDDAP